MGHPCQDTGHREPSRPRRPRLPDPAVLLLLVAACLAWTPAIRPCPAAERRNIVLMIGDDHGLELGCYGHPVVRTPALDRLAARGTRFTHAFAAVSSCSPSRAVIYTGMYSHTAGQYGLAHGEHNFVSFENLPSLPRVLGEAGYRTALIGKLHVRPESSYPFEIVDSPGGPRDVIGMARAAAQFMARTTDRPFLLVIGFVHPHRAGEAFGNEPAPAGPPEHDYAPGDMVVPPFLPDLPETRAELAAYARAVSRMDRGVGAVLDAIEAAGRSGDTMVAYLSDNGIPWPGAKTTLYDAGLRLPLLVACPGRAPPGSTSGAMVSWVDLAPTILDWAGVRRPERMAGRSFLQVMGQPGPAGWDEVFASHTFHEVTMYYPMRMIRTRRFKYILNLAHALEYPLASDLRGSRTWQAVLRAGDGRYGNRTVDQLLHRPREELYDLQTDPGECRNLAANAAFAPVLDDLRARLRHWQERTGDPWVIRSTRP